MICPILTAKNAMTAYHFLSSTQQILEKWRRRKDRKGMR